MLKEFITVKMRDENEKVLEEIKIFVKKPTNNILSVSDKYKAKVWNECLSDGILTKMELSRLMEKRNIWNKDMENEQDDILKEIADLEKDLYLGSGDGKKKTVKQGQDTAIEIRKQRMKLRDLIAQKIMLEENTAESIAENGKFDYLVSECTFHEDGERVYQSVEEYNNRDTDDISTTAATELARMLYNIDKDFEKNLPENKWLEKFELVDSDLHIVNKEKQKVDINGLRVDDEGNYINDDKKRVDKEGNLLEEDGTYVLLAEYEDRNREEVDKKPKRTRKKTVVAES